MARKKIDFATLSVEEIKIWLGNTEPNKTQIRELQRDERAGVRKTIEAYLRARERATAEAARIERMWSYERRAAEDGHSFIAGIDEAGRGPLAGPVVAAAVILPVGIELPGLNDSKQVREEVREELYDLIREGAIAYGVGVVNAEEIDRVNILQATFEAARQALSQLSVAPDYLLTDFLKIPGVAQPYEAIVNGDANSFSIAAASILAKVTRDRLMVDYAAQYPQYGFDKHKGYYCPEHVEALREHGPCPIHRKTFAPVSELVQSSLFDFTF